MTLGSQQPWEEEADPVGRAPRARRPGKPGSVTGLPTLLAGAPSCPVKVPLRPFPRMAEETSPQMEPGALTPVLQGSGPWGTGAQRPPTPHPHRRSAWSPQSSAKLVLRAAPGCHRNRRASRACSLGSRAPPPPRGVLGGPLRGREARVPGHGPGRAALRPPFSSHCQEALLMTMQSDQRGRATSSRPHSATELGPERTLQAGLGLPRP